MAARQVAQAAEVVSMADIEHGLQHIARQPVVSRPPPFAVATSSETAGDEPTAQQQSVATCMPQPRSAAVTQQKPSVQPQWGVTRSAYGDSRVKVRTQKGRPLTPGGGWRDDSTKIQPNSVPPTIEGAALVASSSRAADHSIGYATGGWRAGTRLSPPPTAAVLTQGGHVPGWLRYTTMMMRTMHWSRYLPPACSCQCCQAVCVSICNISPEPHT